MATINQTDFKNNSKQDLMKLAFFDNGGYIDGTNIAKTVLTVFFGVSMLLSVLGNVCTCAVVARDRTMRTPTNCYLVNLAITDLLMSLTVPLELYMLWIPDVYPLSELGCYFHFIIWDCLSNSSVLTIVSFTVERYLVVSKPLLRQKLAKKSRVYKIIGISWLISCFFSVFDVLFVDFVKRNNSNYVYCFLTVSEATKIIYPAQIIIFFVIPMAVITVLFVLIAVKLKSTQMKLRKSSVTANQDKDRAVKMLAAVSASFFICWAPYCLLRIMVIMPAYEYLNHSSIWTILCSVSTVNVFLSTAVNPVLYSLLSRKFRQAFKDFLKGRSSARRTRDKFVAEFNIT